MHCSQSSDQGPKGQRQHEQPPHEAGALRLMQATQLVEQKEEIQPTAFTPFHRCRLTIKQPQFRDTAHRAERQLVHRTVGPMLECRCLMSCASAGCCLQAACIQPAHSFSQWAQTAGS